MSPHTTGDGNRVSAALLLAGEREGEAGSPIGDGLIVVDATGQITSENRAVAEILGITAAELVAMDLNAVPWKLIHEDGTTADLNELLGLVTFATAEAVNGVLFGICDTDENVYWVELNTHVLHSLEGHPNGVVASIRAVREHPLGADDERLLTAPLFAVDHAVVVTDPHARIRYCNVVAERFYDLSTDDLRGRTLDELFSAAPDQAIAHGQSVIESIREGERWSGEVLIERGGNGLSFAEITCTPVFDDRDQPLGSVVVANDISERQRAEKTAFALSAIVESTAAAIFTESVDGTVLTWNRGAEELFGYSADEVIGLQAPVFDPSRGDQAHSIRSIVSAGKTVKALETVGRRRDGTHVDVSLTVSPIYGEHGAVTGVSVIGRDVSDRMQLEQELLRQSMQDRLTGLPNRVLLGDRLSQAIAGSCRRGVPVAVLFLDLDQFKAVNDTNGHLAGDELLVKVAQRLRTVIRPADTVARFGGDEFVIVCEELDVEEAELLAERMASALSDPIEINGQRMHVSASIGIAVTPPIEADPNVLMRCADAAMYDAKVRGGARHRVFDSMLAKSSLERIELTNEFRDALIEDALELFYQPLIELASGRLMGVEAMIRWNHPLRGWVAPALFLPLAEESGFGSFLNRWVLTRACQDAAELRHLGVLSADAHVAINVSASAVADVDLVETVREAAASAGLSLGVLDLEVTEEALISDVLTVRGVLKALRDLGVGIALDDFGTGYSSLTYVHQLPITAIKIDHSVIQHIVDRPDDLAVTASIVGLAQSVGLATVAEGIETAAQFELLRELGCVAGQGEYWTGALPRDDFAAMHWFKSTPE